MSAPPQGELQGIAAELRETKGHLATTRTTLAEVEVQDKIKLERGIKTTRL